MKQSASESLSWCWQEDSLSFQSCDVDMLQAMNQGLLYGYGHYTSFLWPISEANWERHWQRLIHDSEYLGLSISPDSQSTFYQAINQLPSASNYRFRLSHIPTVNGFQQLVDQSELSAHWLLTAQPVKPSVITPVSLQIVPYARSHPSVKHLQIADTIFVRRQLQQTKTAACPATDILFSQRKDNTTLLLEAGFANLLLLQPDEKLAISPDPKRQACLPGTEISRVFEEVYTQGWEVQWDEIQLSDLTPKHCLYLTNAVQGVLPVRALYSESTLLWECKTPRAYTDLL